MNTETQKSKQIGQHVYTCRKMMAGEGLVVLARLMNLIGPAVKEVNEEGETLSNVVAGLISNPLLGDQLKFFTQAFAPHTSVKINGADAELGPIFETHFMGNYFELIQWLIFCFATNHGGFLEQAGINVTAIVQAAMQQLSRSPKVAAKPGPSGKSSSPDGLTRPTTA